MNPVLLKRNIFDTATLSSVGFVTTLPVGYMKYQDRSMCAQSTGLSFGSPSIGPTISGSWASAQTINMFALRYHNLTAAATWRLILYSDAAFTTVVYDSGNVPAFAYTNIPSDLTPAYFRLMKNSAMYFTRRTDVKSFVCTINDSGNPDNALKFSRGFAGEYWQWAKHVARGTTPLKFGSLSKSGRARDASLRSAAGAQFLELDIDHKLFSVEADMRELFDAFSYLDSTRDFWFSLFPLNGTWLEMYHQNAWKLPDERVGGIYFVSAGQSRILLQSN